MPEPDDLHKALGLPPPPDQSFPETWPDGSPVAFPTPEEIETLQRDKPSPGRLRRLAWVVLAMLLLLVLYAVVRDPDETSRDGWPGIRMKPVSGVGRGYDAVPDL